MRPAREGVDMTGYAAALFAMVDSFLDGRQTYENFQAQFYEYLNDEVPEDDLSDDQEHFFGLIAEKIDFVDMAIDEESREVGWMTPVEFLLWLKKCRHKYSDIF